MNYTVTVSLHVLLSVEICLHTVAVNGELTSRHNLLTEVHMANGCVAR